MSVTFCCFDAPRTQVPCPFCQDWLERGWIKEGERCDQFCTGFEERSEAPEVNFSQGNVADILRLLGFTTEGGDLYGSCSGGEMRQRIFRARNANRSHLVREPEYIPGGSAGVETVQEGNVVRVQRMGAACYIGGNTDEQTLRRLTDLEALAIYAQEHGFEITWG